jgi:hypothetical protein
MEESHNLSRMIKTGLGIVLGQYGGLSIWGHSGGLPRWLGVHGGLLMCPSQ